MNEEEAVGQATSIPSFTRVNRQSQDAEDESEVAATSAAVGKHRPRETPSGEFDDNEEEEGYDELEEGILELRDVEQNVEGLSSDKPVGGARGSRSGSRGLSSSSSSRVRVSAAPIADESDDDDDNEEEEDLFNVQGSKDKKGSRSKSGGG